MSIHQSIDMVSAQIELINAYKARQARYAAMAVKCEPRLLGRPTEREISKREAAKTEAVAVQEKWKSQKELSRVTAERRALKRYDDLRKEAWAATLPPTKRIINAVAKAYEVRAEEILSRRRSVKVAWPRQVAMYLAKELTVRTLPELGREFDRDHTTVLYAVGKIGSLLLTNEALRLKVEGIRSRLNVERAVKALLAGIRSAIEEVPNV